MPNNKTDEIKVNEIAYVKITWEPVFVLSIADDIASVRRGVMAKSGSYYTITNFTLPELTSEDPKHNGNGFEKLFSSSEGEVSVTTIDPSDDSLLQN